MRSRLRSIVQAQHPLGSQRGVASRLEGLQGSCLVPVTQEPSKGTPDNASPLTEFAISEEEGLLAGGSALT